MHVKIDEDLPKSVVDLLRAEGYQRPLYESKDCKA
jgi:hypothetical protein